MVISKNLVNLYFFVFIQTIFLKFQNVLFNFIILVFLEFHHCATKLPLNHDVQILNISNLGALQW